MGDTRPVQKPGATAEPGCTRRGLVGAAAAAPLLVAARTKSAPIRAIAFDAFPIFDPRPIFAAARRAAPLAPLGDAWFQRLFAYTWRRTSARRYAPFDEVAAEALDDACAALAAPVHRSHRDELVATFSALPVWPDVPERLAAWRAQGLRLALLSNMNDAMLRANVERNGLASHFDAVLSTDRVRAFKPAPEAYAMGPEALRTPRSQIAFAAFAAWDAQGASWFGFPTAWVNRTGQPAESGTAKVAHTGPDLRAVSQLLDDAT